MNWITSAILSAALIVLALRLPFLRVHFVTVASIVAAFWIGRWMLRRWRSKGSGHTSGLALIHRGNESIARTEIWLKRVEERKKQASELDTDTGTSVRKEDVLEKCASWAESIDSLKAELTSRMDQIERAQETWRKLNKGGGGTLQSDPNLSVIRKELKILERKMARFLDSMEGIKEDPPSVSFILKLLKQLKK